MYTYVLNENTPGNRPLLKGNDSATDVLWGDLSLVHGHYSATNADSEATNSTTDAEEGDAVGCSLENGSDADWRVSGVVSMILW
jgi:hypothetical protein